ncbi:acetyl esterase/lipase [Rhodococcus sp. AG1013]|uniref:alpha/beta hydrolase n=1 Tax=Rhodococcus sp. AG1013 TaxID=2183996 RepID=UPI000E0B0B13|nr:alpha/beta hydrolase [Rhodococcus sp. AG1013]RDI32637.1 acetyl esterase/lipase [Rhodococcus sp. AG1013]
MTTTTEPENTDAARSAGHPWRRRSAWTLGLLLTVVLVFALAFLTTPWPGSILVRFIFDKGAQKTTGALEKHAPDGIASIPDLQYRTGDDDAYLDVYFPEGLAGTPQVLPTVIWTHGGAWISGHRTNYAPYFQLIADAGFTVVSLDYSLGPGRKYPTAVEQLRDAHAYVLANAERLHVDSSRIVLAGDSAGAQLSSQLATIATNPEYARAVGIESALQPEQLRGVVLNCGIYDVPNMVGGPGIIGWGTTESIWAYAGTKDFENSEAVAQMSTLHHVTDQFPPSYISGGNADGLTEEQSQALAAKLTGLGVDVTTLFYPDDHEPALGHEYQFDLDNADGMNALAQTIEFIRKHTADAPVN